MRIEFVSLVAASALSLSCGLTSRWLFPGSMPHRTGPSYVFSAEQLRALDTAGNRALRHLRLDSPPFWDPDAEQIANCDTALWKRLHWSGLHDEIPDYAIQYLGITRNGKPVVAMLAFCRRQLEQPGVAEALGESLEFGRCSLTAFCHPDSRSITRLYSTDRTHRR